MNPVALPYPFSLGPPWSTLPSATTRPSSLERKKYPFLRSGKRMPDDGRTITGDSSSTGLKVTVSLSLGLQEPFFIGATK